MLFMAMHYISIFNLKNLLTIKLNSKGNMATAKLKKPDTPTKARGRPQLIVEKADGELWGRAKINGNLIVDTATSLETLKKKIKSVILDFEEIEIDEFEISYDLTSFFEQYPYLNISEIANKSGISQTMMRQYTAGNKFPSEERVSEIEKAIREIGKELTKVRLHKSKREYA